MCVTDRQEGGAVGYLATQCVCVYVIDQVIDKMPIMSENTNRNRRHRRENTTCISGDEHKHHRSFSRFFFILLSSSSSSITDHYKYTKTPTDSSGLTPPLLFCLRYESLILKSPQEESKNPFLFIISVSCDSPLPSPSRSCGSVQSKC